MERHIRVLFVEDVEDDALLVELELRRGGFAPTGRRVDSAGQMKEALAAESWDLVISDYTMPSFSALGALEVLKGSGHDVPFIIVSGSVGEETAVAALKAGAHDFVVKQNLTRLVPAVERELAEARMRRERRQALDALEASDARHSRLLRELQEAVRMRDEFLTAASHELKTPLTSIRLQLEALRKGVQREAPSPERLLPRVEMMLRQVNRLTELIHNLLDVTQLAAGRLTLRPESVELGELVGEVVGRFEDVLASAGCRLALRLDRSVRGTWDRGRLESAVVNLLANAVKYGPGKPIHVAVEGEGGVARLSVRDEGIGIAPEDQARIFERFERAASVRHYGGLGIGLWLVRQVVEAHGGRIQVRSRPGEGSTFTVELPLGPPPA